MAFVCLFIAMVSLQQLSLYQLNVKIVLLNGDLQEEIYMEQPLSFVAQGSLLDWYVVFANSYMVSSSLIGLGLKNLAMLFNSLVSFCFLSSLYVDGIVLTCSDHHEKDLCQYFQTKDLGKLKYFLGIEVAQSNTGTVIS